MLIIIGIIMVITILIIIGIIMGITMLIIIGIIMVIMGGEAPPPLPRFAGFVPEVP
jgi:hypothetical protein